MLPHGQKICQNLGGMGLIGQTVPHRDPRISAQFFHNLLGKAAVFNTIKHPAQNPRRVCNAFLFADLRAGGVEIGDPHAQIMAGHLKGTARAGTGLFKNQRNIFSPEHIMGNPLLLLCFQLRCQIKQAPDFLRRAVQQFEKISAF